MNPDEIDKLVATARARGYSDSEIQDTLASKGIRWAPNRPMTPAELSHMMGQTLGVGTPVLQRLAAAAQGAGLNLPGLVFPGIKAQADSLAQTHPQAAALDQMAGAAMPAGALAKVLGTMPSALLPVMGAAEGATAGAAGADPGQRKAGAIKGGILGGLVGALPVAIPAGQAVGRQVGKLMAPAKDVAMEIARAAHNGEVPLNTLSDQPPTISLDDALARLKTQMPGAEIPGALTPQITKSVRAISANPVASAASQDAAENAIGAVQRNFNQLHDEYQAIQNGPLGVVPIDKNLRQILGSAGAMEGMSETQPVIAFTRLQEIRQDLAKALKTSSPQKQRILQPVMDQLQEFMDNYFQAGATHRALRDIDADYAFANVFHNPDDGSGLLDKYLEMLKGTGSSQAAQGVAGTTAVSPGGTVTGHRSFLRELLNTITDAQARRGAIAARLMAQPQATMPAPVADAGAQLAKSAGAFFTPQPPSMAPAATAVGAPTLVDLMRQRALFGH